MIKKILNTDPNTRISMKEIKAHDWFNQVKITELLEGIVVGKDRIPIVEEAITKMPQE